MDGQKLAGGQKPEDGQKLAGGQKSAGRAETGRTDRSLPAGQKAGWTKARIWP
jgi:hypothetical protein